MKALKSKLVSMVHKIATKITIKFNACVIDIVEYVWPCYLPTHPPS